MPGQFISQPNPPPDPSLLPSEVDVLTVKLPTDGVLTPAELDAIRKFRRAADYIAAAMIFLKDNVLVERDITPEDIKSRLLGHWGTCPGLIMVYAHINRIVRKTNLDALYVVGPGHGAPAILSCLWLENSLSKFLPDYPRNRRGLHNLITRFSVPCGFPSHINAETPGAIHEGGELGYALSVSFGAVMDNPNLVCVCVVGDGEAETGPTATAWHGFKYIDPAESGAVLPIVHVNGFKISERTIYGTMDDRELIALFAGYGYLPIVVSDLPNIDTQLAAAFERSLSEIHRIQAAARGGKPIVKPRWPVIILRTPKGLSGPKLLDGEFVEGSFRSHQVPLPLARTSPSQLAALQEWLRSYRPEELFVSVAAETKALPAGSPIEAVLSVVPETETKKLGQRRESYAAYAPLKVPDWRSFAIATDGKEDRQGGVQESCMLAIGRLLKEVVKENPTTFRIFSPDELVSNKLDAVLQDSGRNFQWDAAARAKGGRVIEMLSEHTCQGMLQGYTLTGRTGLFPSYEAFLGIVHTMMVQYSKFVKMSHETKWREDCGSLNYIETSTWSRQDHNGFSHQNPSFIGAVLNLKATLARVYLPPDANCFLSTVAHCLRARNYINLMVGSKQPSPVWLSPVEAERHCIAGGGVWGWASTEGGVRPDVVLVGIGVETTFEVIAAAALLRRVVPALRVRVVNVTDLMILSAKGGEEAHPHALNDAAFTDMFTADRSVCFNYHGYPIELRGLLFGRPGVDGDRVTIEGYREEGTTTSPFDMMLLNHTSRYHIAAAAVQGGARVNEQVALTAHTDASYIMHLAQKDRDWILEHGRDPDGTFDTPVFA